MPLSPMKNGLTRLLRFAPFTSFVLASWCCLLTGTVFDWGVYEGLGVIWRLLVIPSYLVWLVAVALARPLGPWAATPVFVGTLVLGDLVVRRLRSMNDEPVPVRSEDRRE